MLVKRRKGWRMSCNVDEVTEMLDNELCYDYNCELCSFSNLSVTSPTSQLILQPFFRFIYVTAHSPTLPLLHLRHSSFCNPSFASPTSQGLNLIHLASRTWFIEYYRPTGIQICGSMNRNWNNNFRKRDHILFHAVCSVSAYCDVQCCQQVLMISRRTSTEKPQETR